MLLTGPGAYAEFKSDFDKCFDLKHVKEKGTFFTKETNGHISRKVQPFSQKGTKDKSDRPVVEVPGPGQYENAISCFNPSPSMINMHQKSVFCKAEKDGSPRFEHQSIEGLPKMSVPSIPSRFLTPAMDMAPKSSVDDKNDRIQSIDGFQMSRLVNDPGKVGPQSYFPIFDQTNPIPKSTIEWVNSKTNRQGIPNPITT